MREREREREAQVAQESLTLRERVEAAQEVKVVFHVQLNWTGAHQVKPLVTESAHQDFSLSICFEGSAH